MGTKFILLTALLCVPITGCEKTDDGKYDTIATVKYFDPFDSCEGYMIEVITDEYTKYYKPTDLPDKFKTDGLQIEVSYNMIENVFYYCKFNGYLQMIHIIKIKKL